MGNSVDSREPTSASALDSAPRPFGGEHEGLGGGLGGGEGGLSGPKRSHKKETQESQGCEGEITGRAGVMDIL